MKSINTTIADLKHALQQVLKAVDTKRVTFEIKDSLLYVHACAADAHARALVSATGNIPDSVFPMPGKTLLAIVNAYNGDAQCTITQVEKGLKFQFGGAKVTLEKFNEAEVEIFEDRVKKFEFIAKNTFKASELRSALATVERFAAQNDVRMHFRGVFIQSLDGKLVLTACDGFRLAENVTSMALDEVQPMILPIAFAEALRAVLKDEEDVDLSIMGEDQVRRLRFSTSTFRLDCPLLSAVYPDYKSILPASTATVTVDRVALISAIERMCLVDGPFVQLSFKAGKLTVMTADEESSETLTTEGDDVDLMVSYQAKLLSDSLGAITTELASISVNPEKGVDSRLLLKTTAGDGWKAVVMPVKN
jgi:DNA polymerase III sliding clamp (beta) subunit (PCNA family)